VTADRCKHCFRHDCQRSPRTHCPLTIRRNYSPGSLPRSSANLAPKALLSQK